MANLVRDLSVQSPRTRRMLAWAAASWIALGALVTTEASPANAVPTPTAVAVQSGLVYPWDVAFTPDGKMLVTERPGRVRVYASGAAGAALLATASIAVVVGGEAGLMGIAVDSEFATNRSIYLCATRQVGSEQRNEVLRYRLETDLRLTLAGVILTGMRAGKIHNGCAVETDAAGHVWASMGDADDAWSAQDPASLNGKILRVTRDGAIPPGNPLMPGAATPTAVYSMGHRNPQGIAFRPGTGEVYAIEHGPQLDDEINVLVAGGNYGWPCYTGYGAPHLAGACGAASAYREPVWASGSPTLATSGGAFAVGASWGDREGQLFVATLKESDLRSFRRGGDGNFTQTGVFIDGQWGRLRAVARGANEALYLTTSNGSNDRVIAVSADQPPPLPNLIANPGFEVDANADGRPDGWTSNARFTRSSVVVHDGAYAGRHSATDNRGYTIYQQVPAAAGARYEVGGWVNIPATTDALDFRLRIQWRGSGGVIASSQVGKLSAPTGGWVRMAGSFTAPPGTTAARLLMKLGSLNATVYVDDFTFASL